MNIEFLKNILEKNGPSPADYQELNNYIQTIHRAKISGELKENDIHEIINLLGEAASSKTMQGFALTKPHGYAGDFEIIDMIYRSHKSADSSLVKWDEFFHEQAAPKAVRNRKFYFSDVMDSTVDKFKNAEVLNIGSGPGQCMHTWLSSNKNNQVSMHCLEMDAKAIEHSQKINHDFRNQIHFEKINVLRYKPTKNYHLIWASGIFDYFNDDVFRFLLKKFVPNIAIGGSMVIGNFSTENPSRAYMELFGDWMLNHRSPNELIELCSDIDDAIKNIRIESEVEGVNLFLHIEK